MCIDSAVSAQVKLLKHTPLDKGPHFQRLMRAPVVVEADPIPYHPTGVQLGLELVAMNAVIF